MAVQPLSPATDRRLGRPLPHQLSNRTRAHLGSPELWYQEHAISIRYSVLASVSRRYPKNQGRLLTRYSPVRHFPQFRASSSLILVRLECVMHAASVHPEPGSNSLKKFIKVCLLCYLCFLKGFLLDEIFLHTQ